MKKHIILSALLLAAVSSTVQTLAQTGRRVDWLHGFNGNTTHWAGYSAAFQAARQLVSSSPAFNTTGTINDITGEVRNQIPDSVTNNIGIGHSLGGVVCRNIEAVGGVDVDGVITVHSPNKGATIAHAVNSGQAQAYFTHVATTLSDAVGSVFDVVEDDIEIWNNIVGLLNDAIDGLNELLDFLDFAGVWIGSVIPDIPNADWEAEAPQEPDVDGALSGFFDLINDPATQNVIDDIDPTSEFVADLNAFPSTLPRIEVHGYEKNREMLRLGCSSINSVWASPLATTTALPDDCLIEVMDDLGNSLLAAQGLLVTNLIVVASPLRLGKMRNIIEAIGDVGEVRKLINGGLEAGYEDLLGTQWTTVTTTSQVFSASCQSQVSTLNNVLAQLMQQQAQAPPGSNTYTAQIAVIQNQIYALQSSPSCWQEVTTTTYVPVEAENAPNDGFILEAEMTTGSALATYQNKEVNHMEVLNHPEMWKNFNLIFDLPTDNFFHTPTR